MRPRSCRPYPTNAVAHSVEVWLHYSLLSISPGFWQDFVPMAGQGSAGNVIAALCSFFIPGLGQLLQGRVLMALLQFCLAGLLWLVLLGWAIHLWSIVDAAVWKPQT